MASHPTGLAGQVRPVHQASPMGLATLVRALPHDFSIDLGSPTAPLDEPIFPPENAVTFPGLPGNILRQPGVRARDRGG